MSTTPQLEITELEAAQSQPEIPVNRAVRTLEAAIQIKVLDKDLNAPPASPAATARYIVGAAPTAAWENRAEQIAYLSGSAWRFLKPQEGWQVWVADEGLRYEYAGGDWPDGEWQEMAGGSGGGYAPVVTDATTARVAAPADAGDYTRFTNAAAKTYEFSGSETWVVGTEFHGRNHGAGNLAVFGSNGMTINTPTDGSNVIPQGGTFTVKIVAATEADLFGVTVAGS